MGPTNKTASLSKDVNEPVDRDITFDDLRSAYCEQARSLMLGGVDLLLVETVFDTLNLKACYVGIEDCFREMGQRLPIMISVTIQISLVAPCRDRRSGPSGIPWRIVSPSVLALIVPLVLQI